VQEGETYEISAARELAEELGIRDTEFTASKSFTPDGLSVLNRYRAKQ